jgi:hypothetical protein
MPSILDNDVETASTSATSGEYPVTDLVRTYLQQTGSKFFGPGAARREQPETRTVHDLWDYLGDFA